MAWDNFSSFSSSNIDSIRYENEQFVLEVTFLNGGIYQYFDVPPHIVGDFKQAGSKGEFLAREIKGRFRYSKV